MTEFVKRFNELDEETQRQAVDNEHALAWMEEHVPLLDCPDKELEEVYYFRWWVWRKHLKRTPEGTILTEFHPPVPWSGPYNSINCAVGHHVAEGRWLRGSGEWLEDDLRFWFCGSGDLQSYSCWAADTVLRYCETTGDDPLARELLDAMVRFYRERERTNQHDCGLFWSNDDRDAMEFSISGSGLRPTLNSYMAANAAAIAQAARLAGREELAEQFDRKAETLRRLMNELLWDSRDRFYKVIPLAGPRAPLHFTGFDSVPEQNNVMEEIGFIPWCFGLAGGEKSAAFCRLRSEAHFKAPFGPTTADRSHPRFRFPHPEHECLWNGPSWPFATSQTLTAAANLLQDAKQEDFTERDYCALLRTYANSHHRVREDGRRVCWIDENLDPFTGDWISRTILKGWGWPGEKGGYERGKDYNHSTFCDLVISGLCGVRPGAGRSVRIHPLTDGMPWDYWRLSGLPCKGHVLRLTYDRDGTHYGEGKGFRLLCDGTEIFCSDRLPDAAIELS